MGTELREPTAVPALPGVLYGLRTWALTGRRPDERLRGPYFGEPWPTGGAWLRAACARGDAHGVPADGCTCGVYGWHPTRASARRALAIRREVAGVVAARGAVAVHADGFRAEEGRPYALVVHPRSNPYLVRRLAEAYDAVVLEIRGPDALLAWCAEHDAGLAAPAVAELLGEPRRQAPSASARSRSPQRRLFS